MESTVKPVVIIVLRQYNHAADTVSLTPNPNLLFYFSFKVAEHSFRAVSSVV